MLKKRSFLVFFFFCFSVVGLSQSTETVEHVFIKLNEKYGRSNNYSLTTSYRLYKGHDSGILSEHYIGRLYHSNEGTYQKVKNTEYISTDNYSLKVNHDEKAMVLDKGINRSFFEEYNSALKACSSFELEEKTNNWIVSLFFYGPSNLPFYKLTITVNKSSYDLKEINIYYSSKVDFDPSFESSDWAKPHLKIKFNATTQSDINSSIFDKENYYRITSGKLTLNSRYSAYQLINNLR